MDIEVISCLQGRKKEIWTDFLTFVGLEADSNVQTTVLIWEDEELVATGSRQDNLLKCIAVSPMHQGEGLTATLITHLRQDAFSAGHKHLFLYTKPQNRYLFAPLFFYPIAQTDRVLLMENRQNGIGSFLDTLPVYPGGEKVGSIVMNCNPFTLGHQYLIETAARECDHLYVFVLSEDKSYFRVTDRMEMVQKGTEHIPNVTVLPTGPYLISSATFPTYFLKDRENSPQIQCLLDIEIFVKYYVPKFGITHRFVGTEPLSPTTNMYNEALKTHLPAKGIVLQEIPRLCSNQTPISASAVRTYLKTGDYAALPQLLPETTIQHLTSNNLI